MQALFFADIRHYECVEFPNYFTEEAKGYAAGSIGRYAGQLVLTPNAVSSLTMCDDAIHDTNEVGHRQVVPDVVTFVFAS